MLEIIFLVVLALIFILFAVVADFKYRIVPNWLNFSLIVFAFAFRFFYSLFNSDFNLFYQGLIGFGIFFALGNALYYGRMFAGGDAKLMMALGVILPFSDSLISNLQIFLLFLILFLFSGAAYGIAMSAILLAGNFKECKKEISKQFYKNKKLILLAGIIGILTMIFSFGEILFYLGILVFLLPFLYILAKAVDEKCLIKKMKTKDLGEGEWLYENVKVGKKTVKSSWEGLSKEELKLIKKKFREIKIRQGIPFTPAFLISFVLL
ncbi:MAG: A24 family peptidase, partial [Nanoarchaeota archaeon]